MIDIGQDDKETRIRGSNIKLGNDEYSEGIKKLATIKGIDAMQTGLTTLYTVPLNKQLVITSIVVRCTEATDVTGEASVSIGANNPDYNDWLGAYYLADLKDIAQNLIYHPNNLIIKSIYQADDVLKINITEGATGTSQTLAVDLFGYFLPAN